MPLPAARALSTTSARHDNRRDCTSPLTTLAPPHNSQPSGPRDLDYALLLIERRPPGSGLSFYSRCFHCFYRSAPQVPGR